jgi:two-component system, sensor histidine kinase ChiS
LRHTIYLVDDDPDFLASFGEHLVDLEFRVVMFQSGDHLMRHQPQARPSLIISDYLMPGMSGSELLSRLRKDSRWRGVPTVVITGSNDRSLPLRIDAPVVYKPNVDGMLATIRSVLGTNQEP